MRKLLSFLYLFLVCYAIKAQKSTTKRDSILSFYENSIKQLDGLFEKTYKTYKKEKDSIMSYSEKINNTLTLQQIESISNIIKNKKIATDTLAKQLNGFYKKFVSYKTVYLDSEKEPKLSKEELDALFDLRSFETETADTLKEPETVEEDPQVYAYFGKDKVLKDSFVSTKTNEGKIFSSILEKAGKDSYFGDITVPKENQELPFFHKTTVADKSCGEKMHSSGYYNFKKLEVEIRDGNFADIRVTVTYNGNIHTFENHKGIGFHYFSSLAKCNFLFYKQTIINNKPTEINEMNSLRIRLSDVMNYSYKMGNHYIPHDLVLELPQEDVNNQKTNENSPAKYQIKQSTHLEKIVELRAYSDFLSLFGVGETNNGLISIEGSAKFYIFPFPRQMCFGWRTQVEWLTSFSPYVRFNKFSENDTYIEVPVKDYKHPVDLIENRFLIMGGEFNLLQFSHKYFPVKANVYGVANYQLTKAKIVDAIETVKGFGLGGGINLSTKRFNNFGFNYKVSLSYFDYKNFNNFSSLT